uniref:NADH-ubiquinone oxidoreductase chain 3 n=1 Tax=Oligolophus tienmushanensis TaxID=1508515 RepID=A0A140X729_9ARAC|nr:NADH dehydrogenase subunit 3 [Oligolophus tienmushanensis]AIG60114.1 NADH dehydrogenase subunit 3 [Oligolophus tienmushanensis]
MTMTYFYLTMLMSMAIMILSSNLASMHYMTNEKNSPFECGFNPSQKSRTPFSLQFFLITLIFIIFDVEIILIMPTPLFLTTSWKLSVSISTLIIIIFLGLLHEWNEGSLKWV